MANVVNEVTKNLTGLRDARKKAGLTQAALADLIGSDRANIAQMESAARSMSYKMGRRLSEHVDADSAELVIANRLAAMKRAEKEHDPAGVLMAAKSILELADGADLTDEGEAFIDAIADRALTFAGKSGGDDGGERYDEPGHDGRDLNGHRIVPLPGRDEDDFEDAEEDW